MKDITQMVANQPSKVYALSGVNIHSCLPFPELGKRDGVADVTFRYGKVPAELPNARVKGVRFQASPGRLLLVVDGVARYLVRYGTEILIERFTGIDDDTVRLFLLGSAFGALLHQRGILALHASVIAHDGGAVAFLGPSGIGKSTLAASLCSKGFPFICDDVCAVELSPTGQAWVWPGCPQVKLWDDSMEKLKEEPAMHRPIRPGFKKRILPLDASAGKTKMPLVQIYELTAINEKEMSVISLKGPEKFIVLKNHTYRPQFLDGLQVTVPHFKLCTALASRLPICRVTRPHSPFLLEELVAMITRDFQS